MNNSSYKLKGASGAMLQPDTMTGKVLRRDNTQSAAAAVASMFQWLTVSWEEIRVNYWAGDSCINWLSGVCSMNAMA